MGARRSGRERGPRRRARARPRRRCGVAADARSQPQRKRFRREFHVASRVREARGEGKSAGRRGCARRSRRPPHPLPRALRRPRAPWHGSGRRPPRRGVPRSCPRREPHGLATQRETRDGSVRAGAVSADERPVSRGAKALAIALALLAPARMAWIVFTYGENNLSNDYVARVPIVAAILDGRYPFAHLFRDTWIWGGHSWLALLPFYWAEARYFAWDLRVELGIGLLLTVLKTLLVWLAVSGPLTKRARLWLLPVLSFLAFSVSQITVFTFGEPVLPMQLAQVALTAGAIALIRLADRPGLRAASLAACGLLASGSWGAGVMVWPVFAVALFASGERSLRRWVLLSLGATLGLSQYVWFLVVAPFPRLVK